MWKHLVTGIPSSIVVLISVWFRAAPLEPTLTSFTSVGPGGCSADCSCPTCPVVTCEAERFIAATATASLQWWWSLTLISLVVNSIVVGCLWVSLPYICVGVFESKRPSIIAGGKTTEPIITLISEVKAEQATLEGASVATLSAGKGGPVTPGSLAAWRKSQGI
ncbi:unnamed protein product [Polarella glacialis]|uniref:Uncharacterized protein n=1 Tax=Polarella glacialis TaxID=89957 RepID=A0A813LNQ7_POLGL|nr:unnamed protein product [Polarella glacialis]CAE8737125.1 unnamed protein product [Polarella glacialis]